MEYIVIETHKTEFPNPIVLKQNEKVIIEDDPDPDTHKSDWINWIFCAKMDGSNKGYVPEQIIKRENNYGIVIENYSANELDINVGTIVEGIKELNGWLWLKNKATNEIGWVPTCKLKQLN